MIKNSLKKILSVFLFSIIILIGLYIHTRARNNRNGGFKRMIIPHALGKTKSIDLQFNSFYISGLDSETLLLSNRTAPSYLLRTDRSLNNLDTFHIRLRDSLKRSYLFCAAFNSTLYLCDPNQNVILRAFRPYQQPEEYQHTAIPYFNSLLPVSSGSVILRTYNNELKKNTLTKLNWVKPFIREMPDLVQSGNEGYFSTDGTLCFDKNTRQLIYVYRYRNTFITMDSNLNLIHQDQTIDTTDRPQLNIGSFKNKEITSTTFSSPPFEINRNACASDGLLYVCSNVRAENEEQSAFDLYSTLDVYQIKNGRYQFSFYILKENNHPISSFQIDRKTLYVICDHYLTEYELTF